LKYTLSSLRDEEDEAVEEGRRWRLFAVGVVLWLWLKGAHALLTASWCPAHKRIFGCVSWSWIKYYAGASYQTL